MESNSPQRDVAAVGRTEFSGQLCEVGVGSLLQSVELMGKSCVIGLQTPRGRGRIWVAKGRVIDADLGPVHGAEAVYRLLGVERGRFSVEFRRLRHRPRTELKIQALLMEGMRRHDEGAALWKVLPEAASILRPQDRFAAPASAQTLLCAFEGEASIADVLDQSREDELQTLAAIAALLKAGHLVSTGRTAMGLPFDSYDDVPARAREEASWETFDEVASVEELAAPGRRRFLALTVCGLAVAAAVFAWPLRQTWSGAAPAEAGRVVSVEQRADDAPPLMDPVRSILPSELRGLDAAQMLDRLNTPDPGLALPYSQRHALLDYASAQDWADEIDRFVNVALDLRQAESTDDPCRNFAAALDEVEEMGAAAFMAVLKDVKSPDPVQRPKAERKGCRTLQLRLRRLQRKARGRSHRPSKSGSTTTFVSDANRRHRPGAAPVDVEAAAAGPPGAHREDWK